MGSNSAAEGKSGGLMWQRCVCGSGVFVAAVGLGTFVWLLHVSSGDVCVFGGTVSVVSGLRCSSFDPSRQRNTTLGCLVQ